MNAPADGAFGDTFVPTEYQGQTIICAARDGVPLDIFASRANTAGAYDPTPRVSVFSLSTPVSEERDVTDVVSPQEIPAAIPPHHRPAFYAGLALAGVAVYLMCRKEPGSFKVMRRV